jgi:hypothetical protein
MRYRIRASGFPGIALGKANIMSKKAKKVARRNEIRLAMYRSSGFNLYVTLFTRSELKSFMDKLGTSRAQWLIFYTMTFIPANFNGNTNQITGAPSLSSQKPSHFL